MTIKSIKAHFECDGCATDIIIPIDPAAQPGSYIDMLDLAVDYARGGTYETPPDKRHHISVQMGSVQGGLVLCNKCTSIVDKATEDNPTEEQVRKALAL